MKQHRRKGHTFEQTLPPLYILYSTCICMHARMMLLCCYIYRLFISTGLVIAHPSPHVLTGDCHSCAVLLVDTKGVLPRQIHVQIPMQLS